MLWLDNIN